MPAYKVLVTGPSWIGDMVMAQSLFKLLRQINPEVVIDVLAPAWTLPVVERMAEVRRGIAFPSRHGKLDLMMRIKTGWQLKGERYDEGIIIPRSLKAALPSWIAGIKKRSGLRAHFGLINNKRNYRRDRNELFVRRFLALASDEAYQFDWEQIPKPRLSVNQHNQRALLQKFGLQSGRYVVFAPGAEFGPAKQWPAEHFAALADLLEKRQLTSVIMGAAKESNLARTIIDASKAGSIVDLSGKTSLPDVVDLMSASHSVVANDSGLMHLAYASGSKVIAIYGSSSSMYTPPLSDRAIVLEHDLSCSPCFERTCRYGHYNCLKYSDPQEVSEMI